MTPEAYRLLRSARDEGRQSEGEAVGLERCLAAARDSLLDHASILVNDLEPPVFGKLPRLAMLLESLVATGPAWARMSGSGSTIVGAFRGRAERDAALELLRGQVPAIAAETESR